MIKKFNNLSLLIGLPGLILQAYGTNNNSLIWLIGTLAVMIAFFYYAKAKGRHPLFGILGLLSLLGLIVLVLLKDKSGSAEVKAEGIVFKIIVVIVLVFLMLAIGIPMLMKLTGAV